LALQMVLSVQLVAPAAANQTFEAFCDIVFLLFFHLMLWDFVTNDK
jgi:hypothetical protein